MAGEIGNKALLRAVGEALEMVDQKVAPGNLDTSQVVVTVPLGVGWANFHQQDLSTASVARGGNPSMTWEPIGAGAGAQSPGVDPFGFVLSSGFEWAILGWAVTVTYDAAGAAADAGKHLTVDIHRTAPGVGSITTQVASFQRWDTIDARTSYVLAWPMGILQSASANPMVMPGARPIFVPNGSRLTFTIAKTDGTNFPANTTIKGTASIIRVPAGFQPPGL